MAGMMTRTAAALLIGLLLQATTWAARATREPAAALPAAIVLTNLRSPTGRTIYLLLRPSPGAEGPMRQQAEQVADAVGAALKLRPAGALWIAVLTHKERGLDVHRLGQRLQVEASEPTPLSLAKEAGVRLRPGQPEADLDQEIVLTARRAMSDRESVQPSLVALAQGAAARLLLSRYVSGDDLGATLSGERYLPLLQAHPDAALLREVIEAAERGLEVAIAPVPEGPPRPHAPPPAWDEALVAADKTRERAQGWLAEQKKKPMTPMTKDKDQP